MTLGGYGPTIVGVMWVETIIALIFVCLRLYTRIRITRTAGWDDYLIIVSWLLLMPYTVACTVAASRGFGRHAAELLPAEFVEATKAEIIGQTFCIIGIATSKASAAIFLLRITVIQWHRWLLYFMVVSVTIPCFLCALFDFIRCDPIAHVWNPTIEAHCWVSTEGFTSLSITVGITSAAADLVLSVIPWFILWNLQMKRDEKILIAASMSLGLFAMVCGIVRTIALEGLTARSDYSYQTVGLILWSATELMVTILTATIPTLRPLWNSILGRSRDASYDDPNRMRTRSYKLKNVGGDMDTYTGTDTYNGGSPELGPHSDYSKTTIVGGKQDDRSDKSILERGDGGDGAITKTNVVTVQVDYDEEAQWKDTGRSWSKAR